MMQGLEAAGALVVVLQQEALEACLVEYARNRLVVAPGVEFALVVPTADMHPEGHTRVAADDGVVHLNTYIDEFVRVAAALAVAFAHFRIEQSSVLGRVDLDVGAA